MKCSSQQFRNYNKPPFRLDQLIWFSCWFCILPPPLIWGSEFVYLRSPKGGCFSITDDLSCSVNTVWVWHSPKLIIVQPNDYIMKSVFRQYIVEKLLIVTLNHVMMTNKTKMQKNFYLYLSLSNVFLCITFLLTTFESYHSECFVQIWTDRRKRRTLYHLMMSLKLKKNYINFSDTLLLK